jgi:ribosomal protein S27AE
MDIRNKHLSSEDRGVILAEHNRGSSQRWDCSKSGGFALVASEKRLDRGLYGVVSLYGWGRC